MKMKKYVALFLCIVLATIALVGCETPIGEYYYEVYQPNNVGVKEEKPEMTLDFYIVTEFPENYDDADVKSQHNSDLVTVKDNINLHLKDKYKTTLNIHFISAEDYDTTVKSATSGIVLINSESLMNELMQGEKLADLTNFLESDEYEFGTLNVQIASTLLEAARVEVEEQSKLYCIPNNHIVGSYDYIAVNNAVAAKLQYGKNDIAEIDTPEEAAAFASVAKAKWSLLGMDGAYSAERVVRQFDSCSYGYESEDALRSEWTYNIYNYPVVTKAEAYSTAYGILSGTENTERAMEIIYALNTDVQFRNLLQYGVLNNDYEILNNQNNGIASDETYVLIKNTLYKMNILYTGDVFKAYYNQEFWTEDMAIAGKMQNAQSILPVESEE